MMGFCTPPPQLFEHAENPVIFHKKRRFRFDFGTCVAGVVVEVVVVVDVVRIRLDLSVCRLDISLLGG